VPKNVQIQAVTVNHNTSMYTELMLRSLTARHPELDVAVTIMDNASTDNMAGLRDFAEANNFPIVQSGYDAGQTKLNSHGEILSQFVLDHPDCDYYLFLDADVVFLSDNTLQALLHELEKSADVFGVGPRQTWDGQDEIPEAHRAPVYYSRLHPCCALIRNTALFRQVVEVIGLTGVKYCWSKQDDAFPDECEKYLDTCELMTRVMGTHGLKHRVVAPMILHFFSVSYDDRWMESKNERCQKMLADYRAMG
jgi:hypothetical protein